MPTLLFTVAPASVVHIHDLLACLARFDEDIAIEATPQFVSSLPPVSARLTKLAPYLKLEHLENSSYLIHLEICVLQQVPLLPWATDFFYRSTA
jgi:hypothetical protein